MRTRRRSVIRIARDVEAGSFSAAKVPPPGRFPDKDAYTNATSSTKVHAWASKWILTRAR